MRIGVLSGGGDAPGLNAVIRAVTKTAIVKYGWQVTGIIDGFEGLLTPTKTRQLTSWNTRGILAEGGTILGTTNRGNPFAHKTIIGGREIIEDMSPEVLDNIAELGLDVIVVIGGDGSLKIGEGIHKLGVPVIGVPKTIDNDLMATYVTFGYQTAVDTATEALDKLHTTAESHQRVIMLEVMGRYAGWIALEAGISGSADVILIPEIPFSMDKVVEKLHERKKAGSKSSIVVVAEGAKPSGGEMAVREKAADGYVLRLGGMAEIVANEVSRRTSFETRVTVLGHVQRGGSPCPFDRLLATRYGSYAVELIAQKKFGEMVSFQPPVITSVPLASAISNLKLVDPGGELVKMAEGMGGKFRQMILFILTVFTIYGGVHGYAFLKARSAFAFGPIVGAALALFMLLMVFAIFLTRTLEAHEYDMPARMLSYVAYFWMAALFIFFCGSLLFDGVTLITRTAGWITRHDISPYLVPVKTAFFINLGLALVICAYGYGEAKNIRTERLVIETAKLPAGIEKLVVVQMSDVHLGLINRRERFGPMINAVKDAKPDYFIVTGDLVDAQINHLSGLADMLRAIQAPYGKYAIMGNHEYYAGPEKSLAFIREAGLTMLRDEVATGGPITIVGIDDRTALQLHLGHLSSEKKLLSGLSRDKFILYLKHQPRIDPNTIGLFDLQLSGHTHKGQIFPFTLLTRLTFPLNAGNYDLGKGSLLHVSRGTGTWGPPIRFLAPPEITIIELVRKSAS